MQHPGAIVAYLFTDSWPKGNHSPVKSRRLLPLPAPRGFCQWQKQIWVEPRYQRPIDSVSQYQSQWDFLFPMIKTVDKALLSNEEELLCLKSP